MRVGAGCAINDIIPTLYAEVESDGCNESDRLLNYFLNCNAEQRDVIDNVMMYICGWTFETILAKCGIKINEKGEPSLK